MDKQKETLARLLGVEAGEIAVASASTTLLQKGVILTLHVGRWRARRNLGLGDLGINEKQQSDLLNLGQKLLLPPEYLKKLQSIETAARNFIKVKTYETQFGAFVPIDAFQFVKDGLDGYKAQYMAVRDEIVDSYDDIKAQLLSEYRTIARTAYSRQQRLAAMLQEEQGCAAYVERFVERIEALIPSKEEIKASFKFDVRLSYVPLPSMLSEDSKELVDIIVEQNGESGSDELLTSTSIQLRERIIDTLESVLETIASQGKLHPRSAASLQNLIDNVSRLNWAGDVEIKAMLNRVVKVVNDKVSDTAQLEDAFKGILTVARATVIDLGSEPRQSRLAGVADVPTVDAVRQARGDLGLPTVEPVAAQRGKRMM